mgnify:CR=1 FL=1
MRIPRPEDELYKGMGVEPPPKNKEGPSHATCQGDFKPGASGRGVIYNLIAMANSYTALQRHNQRRT